MQLWIPRLLSAPPGLRAGYRIGNIDSVWAAREPRGLQEAKCSRQPSIQLLPDLQAARLAPRGTQLSRGRETLQLCHMSASIWSVSVSKLRQKM